MATMGFSDEFPICNSVNIEDPISKLYPMVNEDETPLPRCWSPKDKFNNFIGLSQNNLKVHYKGYGKSHKDAASVRATQPIPAACGLYYYEVTIISKGRDGYMGIGLSSQGVNMNRLPGWDKNSYGYHGDDGHSFCCSGTGQPYGPTFTTGDVIGCGINLIDNICFYTKNGHYLGVAFTDLPPNLYPTVGLQTPGEVIDTNFGQLPFVFDITEMTKELKNKVATKVHNFPVSDTYGQWQTMLHKMVSTYLVHHGYCATAEAFARSTSQDLEEELASIRNRQRVQKLVLAGKLGEAIKIVNELYPALLDKNQNLLFMLRVRQFIEMVNGTDTEVASEKIFPPDNFTNISEGEGSSSFSRGGRSRSPTPVTTNPPSPSCWANGKISEPSQVTPVQQHTSVIQSTKGISRRISNCSSVPTPSVEELNQRNSQESHSAFFSPVPHTSTSNGSDTPSLSIPAPLNPAAAASSGVQLSSSSNSVSTSSTTSSDNDVEMFCVEGNNSSNHIYDNVIYDSAVINTDECNIQNNGFTNGFSQEDDDDLHMEEMDVEGSNSSSRKMCGGNPVAIEKMLILGRELQQMSQNLRRDLGKNKQNKLMLQDAFSLLAYNDPWNSPVGWQLDPVQRELVCQALNSAILESYQLPRRPPLEICIAHTKQLINLMSKSGLGSCAYTSTDSILSKKQERGTSNLQTTRQQPPQQQSLPMQANSQEFPSSTSTSSHHHHHLISQQQQQPLPPPPPPHPHHSSGSSSSSFRSEQ